VSVRVEFPDADTGDIIIFVRRRGRFYPVLIDRRTRVFKRWLRGITVRLIGTVDYEGRRKNPIYIDAKIITTVMREKFMFMVNVLKIRDFFDDIVRKMRDILSFEIKRKFSPSIEGLLAKYGKEYSSRLTNYRYPTAFMLVIWGRDSGVHELGAERYYRSEQMVVELV